MYYLQVEVENLDYHHYLPLFFDGLRETKEPYVTIACRAAQDMMDRGGNKTINVVPQLILPIKGTNTSSIKVI